MTCARCTALAVLTFASALFGFTWSEPTPAAAQPELVIHKQGTNLYHRPGCPLVQDGVGVLALTRGQAEARGYKPHPDCDPSISKAAGAGPAATVPRPQPAVTVYVDGPKYYHRKSCPKLDPASKTVKKVPLEAAAKTHWPCPTCKAPVFRKSTEPAVPGTNRRRGG